MHSTGNSHDYETDYTYNEAGQVLTRRSHLATNQWSTESYSYDAIGNLTSYTLGYYTDDSGIAWEGMSGNTTCYTV